MISARPYHKPQPRIRSGHLTKARAADSVLDHSAKAIELEDIEAQVAELERAADRSAGTAEPASSRKWIER